MAEPASKIIPALCIQHRLADEMNSYFCRMKHEWEKTQKRTGKEKPSHGREGFLFVFTS